jgi:hypothetical protein
MIVSKAAAEERKRADIVGLLKYARAYQSVELSSGYVNLPRERPRHAARRRGSRGVLEAEAEGVVYSHA